jgi:hypothetical protein
MMTIKLNKLSAVLLSLIVLVSLSILPEAKADSNADWSADAKPKEKVAKIQEQPPVAKQSIESPPFDESTFYEQRPSIFLRI